MAGKHILVVEDDDSAQYICSRILQLYGYQTSVTAHAETAWELVQQAQPDLLLVDIGLPGMDGLELTRRVKSHPEYRHIPVVIITVYAFEEDERKAMEAGCDLFLKKPVRPTEVATAIREIIGGEEKPRLVLT